MCSSGNFKIYTLRSCACLYLRNYPHDIIINGYIVTIHRWQTQISDTLRAAFLRLRKLFSICWPMATCLRDFWRVTASPRNFGMVEAH